VEDEERDEERVKKKKAEFEEVVWVRCG